jgi:hypothetical protein
MAERLIALYLQLVYLSMSCAWETLRKRNLKVAGIFAS